MNLRDVIDNLEALASDATVVAERIRGMFLPGSKAAIVELTDEELVT
jgi:hypothetical protein